MKILIRNSAILLLLFSVLAPQLNAGTIVGTVSPVPAGTNIDLTLIGESDWVHWGLYTSSSINRKEGVQSQISDFSTFGNLPESIVPAYQYSDNFNGYTWEDGTPVTGVTNTTTGVYCIQDFPWNPAGPPTGFGFQFTAPADTMWRTLQIFAGSYAAVGKLQATLSDGGAGYTDISLTNASNGPGVLYSLNYQAASSNQVLTVKWSLAARAGTDINKANVTLQAAALTVTNANNPPFVSLTNPVSPSAFAEPATITLAATAFDFNGTVTNVEFYAGTNKLGETPIPPYSFTWTNVIKGHYFLTARAIDEAGAARSSTPVEVFVYGSGGTVQDGVATPPASVDLTSEGTADWTHWGLVTNTSFDYKASVPRQISNFVLLGTTNLMRLTNDYTSFSWNDGTPTTTNAGNRTGVFVSGISNGFSLTATADTNARTLRVYVGCYAAETMFEAYLSDLSAAPYFDSSVSSYGDDYAVYTITYAAAAPNQTLHVIYQTKNLFDYDFGNITLQSASLQGAIISSPPTPVQLLSPQIVSGRFVFSFISESNHNYQVQSENFLAASNWTTITNISGTGGMVGVTNPVGGTAQTFYRVQTQ